MITTVCLNPCMDRSISIAEFKYGGMNRVKSVRSDAGGVRGGMDCRRTCAFP